MMDPSLEKDSLFQLNVLIWASLRLPAGFPITPVLSEAGYDLWAIEQPLDAGIGERRRLDQSDPKINPNPVADAVFLHHDKRVCAFVECKPDSFGSESGRAPQARGLIVAGGNFKARLPGLVQATTAEVCYLVPADVAAPMDATLLLLRGEVANQGFTPATRRRSA